MTDLYAIRPQLCVRQLDDGRGLRAGLLRAPGSLAPYGKAGTLHIVVQKSKGGFINW